MPSNEWMDMEKMRHTHIYTHIHTHYWTTLQPLKGGDLVLRDNMGEPWVCYARWNKPGTERKCGQMLLTVGSNRLELIEVEGEWWLPEDGDEEDGGSGGAADQKVHSFRHREGLGLESYCTVSDCRSVIRYCMFQSNKVHFRCLTIKITDIWVRG